MSTKMSIKHLAPAIYAAFLLAAATTNSLSAQERLASQGCGRHAK